MKTHYFFINYCFLNAFIFIKNDFRFTYLEGNIGQYTAFPSLEMLGAKKNTQY
jgi:hypothetical protein